VSTRILIAGVGNVFHGDAGFGVEVARRLERHPLPEGITVSDVGLRSLHLAYAMLDRPDLLLVVDAVRRGGEPGTIYLMDATELASAPPRNIPEARGMSMTTVVTAAWTLGGKAPPILLVGCEPEFVGERMGLSVAVKSALAKTEDLIHGTVARWLGNGAGQPMLIEGIAKSSQEGVWLPSLDG
jgi:hydrogenase maturation protease